MQASHLKKVIFFVFLSLRFLQVANCQTSIGSLKKADSLFAQQQYAEAEKNYQQFLKKNGRLTTKALLKMAFIEGEKNNFAEKLFYLNSYFEKVLDKRVLQEMNELAVQNNLKGYELSDFNFLVLLFKQYGLFLIGGMLLLGIYIFGVIVFKRFKKQHTPLRHKVFMSIYLIGLVVLINLTTNFYQQAITKHDKILLRDDASAGANIVEEISKGHRLTVLGKKDIWYRVLWDDKIVFLKNEDVWVVK